MAKVFKSICSSLVVVVALFGPAAAQDWTVKLSTKQAKKLGEMQSQPKHQAFAVSPDGAWGRAWGKSSVENAEAAALQFCREHLKPNKRDCIVFARNGKQLVQGAVTVPVVRQVYKPVDGKKARAFFGVSAVDYLGDHARAKARIQAVMAAPNVLVRDDGLARQLRGRSLVSNKAGGFAIYLGSKGADQAAKVNGGRVIGATFSDWAVSKEGLLCLFGGRWNTGKPAGTRCIILANVAAGKLSFAWDGTPDTLRNGWIVQGDATRVAVR